MDWITGIPITSERPEATYFPRLDEPLQFLMHFGASPVPMIDNATRSRSLSLKCW